MCQRLHNFLIGNKSTYGQPSAESLCDGEDIRCDPKMFEGKKFSRPAHPTLNFIKDKNRARLIAPVAHGLQVIPCGNPHTGVSLNGFHNNARRT